MNLNPRLKHLPETDWPVDDRLLFKKAFATVDIFDEDRSAGAHLSTGTRRTIRFGLRRWLGFLEAHHRETLSLPPADRITPDRVREYVDDLRADMVTTSVATTIAQLYNAARLIAPDCNWSWLKVLKRRLQARADSQDRFERLVPPHKTLDLGITLMETAGALPITGRMEREIQFRDGLLIAFLSLWPIRRRSLAALTLNRHVRRIAGDDYIQLLLFSEDTKSKREEVWAVPKVLIPYVRRYLDEVRPRLAGRRNRGALWVGQHTAIP